MIASDKDVPLFTLCVGRGCQQVRQVCSHQLELLRHEPAGRGCLSLPNKLH